MLSVVKVKDASEPVVRGGGRTKQKPNRTLRSHARSGHEWHTQEAFRDEFQVEDCSRRLRRRQWPMSLNESPRVFNLCRGATGAAMIFCVCCYTVAHSCTERKAFGSIRICLQATNKRNSNERADADNAEIWPETDRD